MYSLARKCRTLLFYLYCLLLFLPESVVGVKYDPVVLLLSKGRSGSTWLCNFVIPNLKQSSVSMSNEILGRNVEEMLKLKDPLHVAKDFLRKQRKKNPRDTIGFKWKPVPVNSTHHDALLRWVSMRQYPVIHSHRNPVDLALSHCKWNTHAPLSAHCRTDECVSIHKNVSVRINITDFLNDVESETAEMNGWKHKLSHFGVKSLELYYDDLVYASDQKRLSTLQSIVDFIYPNEGIVAQLSHLENSEIDITTEYDHSKVMDNYEEVALAMEGTEYAKYLHPGKQHNARMASQKQQYKRKRKKIR